jgi:hypothetical protein
MRRCGACKAIAFSALLLSCASGPSLEGKVWAKADRSYAAPGDYERADGSCREPGSTSRAATGSYAYLECMQRQGWIPVDAP